MNQNNNYKYEKSNKKKNDELFNDDFENDEDYENDFRQFSPSSRENNVNFDLQKKERINKNNEMSSNSNKNRENKDYQPSYLKSESKVILNDNLQDLISEAKKNYDLGNIDDNALGAAIKKAKGNIDEAVINLFK
jgi:hypothetical protein